MRFLLFLYIFLFLALINHKLYLYAFLSLILIPVAIYIKNYIKNSKIIEYKRKIRKAKKAFKKQKKIEPFLNINEEPWTIIELLPGVTRVRAKILANSVKQKKVSTFEEFANICGLEPALYALNKTIIKF